jgi:hypothetical protein
MRKYRTEIVLVLLLLLIRPLQNTLFFKHFTPVFNGLFKMNCFEVCTALFLIVVYLMSSCVNLAFFGTRGPLKRLFHSRFKMAHSCQKRSNLQTNELNTAFFCSTSPLKAPNLLKSLKLA